MFETCDICQTGLETRTATAESPYHYTESGLDFAYLVGVEVFRCPKCQVEVAAIPNIDGLHRVVADWDEEARRRELREREAADFVLYVITPLMTGVYSIAEAVDDSNKRPRRTLLAVLPEDGGRTFEPHQTKSLAAVSKLITSNGALAFGSLPEVAEHLNAFARAGRPAGTAAAQCRDDALERAEARAYNTGANG